MWNYEKRLQYPVNITQTNPKIAQVIISQLGGPDGELAASMRYLSQRYTMPYKEVTGTLNDIGTEELAHGCYLSKKKHNKKTPEGSRPSGVFVRLCSFLFVLCSEVESHHYEHDIHHLVRCDASTNGKNREHGQHHQSDDGLHFHQVRCVFQKCTHPSPPP